MYPFTRHSDYLQLESHRTWNNEGLNYINIREVFYDLEHITTENIFTSINSGLTISGEWIIDSGDSVMPINEREKRTFCRKGKASFTFTGISLQIRVYVQPTYGSADVRIDGVLPSTIENVKDAVDILSCDSYDYIDRTWGQEYLDIVIANNLTDEEHTVELYCENPGSGAGDWFVIAGYKVANFTNKTKEHDDWITSEKIPGNIERLTLINEIVDETDAGVNNIILNFDSYFIDADGVPMGTLDSFNLLAGESKTIEFYPNITGTEQEGTVSKTFTITANYEDLEGVEEVDDRQTILCTDYDYIAYYGLWWQASKYDTVAEEWVDVTYGDSHEDYVELDFYGDFIDVYIFRKYGTTTALNMYVDGVLRATVSTSYYSGHAHVHKFTLPGLGSGDHVLKLQPSDEQGTGNFFFYFRKVFYGKVYYYSELQETITYNFNHYQIPPFPPEHPRFIRPTDKNPTCDTVNLGTIDLSIPRDNADTSGLWIEKRPATYAVCYQDGFKEILKEYDILILEPRALTRKRVKEFQDLGIKVFCYHSYGAETGTFLNPWDSASGLVPYVGDGNGPGGYASYYNKGGNQFGECSECKHDRRRLEEVTECALNQTNFYAVWAGRCSNACTKDWRTGYEAYSIGGNCGGGYNSGNNWSRTATKACTNSDCDQYNPVHGACQFYETPDDYMFGQDYSIFTPDWPDEDGIWKSFFVNTTAPAWSERIKNHYLPTIFGHSEEIVESVTVNTFQTETEGITVDGFRIARYPLDADEDVIVENLESGLTFVRGIDYHFDGELGIFKFFATDNKPSWGDILQITYTTKGLQADGIFLDTIDTVDIYSSDAYKDAMVSIIGEHHSLYPDKTWVMNRGFTILERLMPFTDFVMFESFISTINWETGEYYEITDPATIVAVQVFIDLLFRLRGVYTFNVLGLNYCDNNDDELKQIITEGVRQYGWLSWTSEISLNDPQHNDAVFTKDLYISTNDWGLVDELPLP